MTKTILLISLTLMMCQSTFSQDSYLKNRWNIKLAYSRFPSGTTRYSGHSREMEKIGHLRLETHYGLFNFMEGGIFLGYCKYETLVLQSDSTYLGPVDASAVFYGLSTNFHLLPLLVDGDDFRFDAYLSVKLGGQYLSSPENSLLESGNTFEYFIGPGLSFYISKHIGIFGEWGYYDNRFSSEWNSLRYGISVKF